jgi:trimeric autotransporter adhesin
MPSFGRIGRAGYLLITLLIGFLLLPGCNSLNPLCGSARPAPVLDSISPSSVVFSKMPPTFLLNATGSHFVAASVVVFNGTAIPTTVVNSTELTVTITSSMISGPGSFTVAVQTPAGTTGDLGCSSGGTSSALALAVN